MSQIAASLDGSQVVSLPVRRFQQTRRIGYSLADQAFSAGGMFLVNLVLARTQTKEEYGMFALSYSLLTFLMGLHNAAILEPFTVYGSGRYRSRSAEYFRLIGWSNAALGLSLTALVLSVGWGWHWIAPHHLPRAVVGLGVTLSVLLSAAWLRRSFYVQRKPARAAATSLVFFATVSLALWIAVRAHVLNSFSVFLILALGWIVAGAFCLGRLPQVRSPRFPGRESFLKTEPHYWREHWKYSRWVLATAFVFQFMHQGYYWLVAGFLSVNQVGNLKALYLLIAPVEQVMISLSFLLLPALTARYVARNLDDFLSLWKRYALAMIAITLLFALTVRLVGAGVMHLLYAGKFDGLAPLLFVLALVPLCTGVGNTFSDALRAAERPRLVFYAYVSSAGATFIAGVPLVIYLGLRGAVYGMLLSGATYTGALALAFWFCLSQSPRGGGFLANVSVLPSHLPIPAQTE
jgi:O-antigen/teichoic acid export membrane protein